MRKRLEKRMTGVILFVTLAFLFSACSGNKTDMANGETNGRNQAVEDANDYVYVPKVFSLEGLMYVNGACQSKDGLYLISPFFEEKTMTAGTQGYYLDLEGKLTKLALRTANGENITNSVESLGVLSDGSLVYIESEQIENAKDTQTKGKRFFMVHASAKEGEEISRADISKELQFKQGSSEEFLSFLKVDKEDKIYISEGKNIWVFDVSGELLYKVITDAGGWIQDMGVTKEGQVVYTGWDSVTGGKCLSVIDENSGTVTHCRENVPDAVGSCSMIPGAEKGVMVNTLSGLVEYDIETQTCKTLLNWADSGINFDTVAAFTLLQDGNILAVVMEEPKESQDELSYRAVLFRKTLASQVEKQEKETVILGVFEENAELLRAVTVFNQSQEEYKIEMVNYGENGDLDFNRFTSELIAGTGPDIFELSGLDLNQLARKGVLEELSPYIEKDAEIKREDYFESVLDAYLVDDNIYTIPNSFTVMGIAGSNAYLANYGNGYGWTLGDILNLAETNPEKEMFGYGSKTYVLVNCLRYNYNQFVDWENGDCFLDSEEFIQLLTFANTFREQYEEGKNGYTVTDKMLDGTLMAEEVSLSSLQDYQIWQALFGEDFILKGFPTEKGTGLVVRGNNMLAINAGSVHKEAAWEFMRSLLTKKHYETENVPGFPTLISAYNKRNEIYMTPEYQLDENGEQTELSKGSYSLENFSVDFRTSTEKEEKWMTDIIESCDRSFSGDYQLENIIREEAVAFFEGQKSAQETADIIQNRVKIYVNENQ